MLEGGDVVGHDIKLALKPRKATGGFSLSAARAIPPD